MGSFPGASPLSSRLVRYDELKPCTTAFIDARTPGSDRKENFTIIGPGVAENPDQFVHIEEPHGFNIGGARQPPHCVNSQHYHQTAEVFLVHSGSWAFRTGEQADEGEVILHPGDLISIPTFVFRGFENVGQDVGFLYAVLGGDDPGRVIWAPDVLEKARGHGLLLMENGRLVDTVKGQAPGPGETPVHPEPRDRLERVVRHANSAALQEVVVRRGAGLPHVAALTRPGVEEAAIIGAANPAEGAPAAPLGWPHGFACRRLTLAPQGATRPHRRAGADVLFVHRGEATVTVDGEAVRVGAGDTFSVPPGAVRHHVGGGAGAELFLTLAGDRPAPPEFV